MCWWSLIDSVLAPWILMVTRHKIDLCTKLYEAGRLDGTLVRYTVAGSLGPSKRRRAVSQGKLL